MVEKNSRKLVIFCTILNGELAMKATKEAKQPDVNSIMVGCDLHSKNMLVKIAVGREKPRMGSYANTFVGRRRLIADLAKQSLKAGGAQVHVLYEASGLGWTLRDELTEAGMSCGVVAPTKVERSPKQKRTKTDEKDAERLLALLRGHILAGNELPLVWVPDKQTRDDREITRARQDVSDKLTKVKAQVQMLLQRNAIEKPKSAGGAWTVRWREWIGELAGPNTQRPGMRIALSSLLRQAQALNEELELLDAEIGKLAQQPRYSKPAAALDAIPGVGPLTAMVFLTEMGDLTRFKNRKQVSAFLGLVPSSNESGEKHDRKGRITREGPARLRKILCQAAWAWVRLNEGPNRIYHAMVDRGKNKKRAIVAIMRMLGVYLWHTGQRSNQPVHVAKAG